MARKKKRPKAKVHLDHERDTARGIFAPTWNAPQKREIRVAQRARTNIFISPPFFREIIVNRCLVYEQLAS